MQVAVLGLMIPDKIPQRYPMPTAYSSPAVYLVLFKDLGKDLANQVIFFFLDTQGTGAQK